MYIEKDIYRKKLLGCWFGKNIGGTLGMPMEWDRAPNSVCYYTHDLTGEPLPNDDLDIQLLWLLALEDHGINIDTKILGEYFNEFMIFTHAEYGTAKTNLRCGLQPPVTGSFNNDFKDSCGAFIRAEIWACLFPGIPEKAAEYALQDAMVDHGDGEGVFAEVFIAAIESSAFFENDIRKLIDIGLSYIPNDSGVSKGVRKALETFDLGISWEQSREMIMREYVGHLEWHYISPEDEEKGYQNGKMGWDAPSNIMIIVFALLFGKGDFSESICTAVHYGEDTDCTAGTVAALLGIMYGIDAIEERWLKPIGNKITTISLDLFRLGNKMLMLSWVVMISPCHAVMRLPGYLSWNVPFDGAAVRPITKGISSYIHALPAL